MAIPTSFQIGAKVSPQTAVDNYASGAAGKGTKWATGYLMPKRDPFVAAAEAADRMIQRINEVGAAGVRAGLARVVPGEVAVLVSTQGPSLYTNGITNKGVPKLKRIAPQLYPAIQQAAANLPPKGDDAAQEQRMILMRRAMKAMRGQFRA